MDLTSFQLNFPYISHLSKYMLPISDPTQKSRFPRLLLLPQPQLPPGINPCWSCPLFHMHPLLSAISLIWWSANHCSYLPNRQMWSHCALDWNLSVVPTAFLSWRWVLLQAPFHCSLLLPGFTATHRTSHCSLTVPYVLLGPATDSQLSPPQTSIIPPAAWPGRTPSHPPVPSGLGSIFWPYSACMSDSCLCCQGTPCWTLS